MTDTSINTKIELDILNEVADFLTMTPDLFDDNSIKSRDASQPALQLMDYTKSGMPAGNYQVTFKQTLKGDINMRQLETYTQEINFKIDAPPHALTNDDVHQVFPPKGNFGDYSAFLPHIVLNDQILPWATSHYYNGLPRAEKTYNITNAENLPWLALVVLDETEADLGQPMQGGEIVEIPEEVIPTPEELQYLVHYAKRDDGSKKAVLIANRFPKTGSTNVMHLIALDKKSSDGKYQSLYSWNFVCASSENTLKGQLQKLNRGSFRLPNSGNKTFDKCLQKGFVSLPHMARNGQRVMSWYRGPLMPADDNPTNLKVQSINSSDQLLRYFSKTKRLDTTYASAWELGKWMTLHQKEVAIKIYHWKKKIAIAEKIKARSEGRKSRDVNAQNNPLLKIENDIKGLFNNSNADLNIPESVLEWIMDLVLLKEIPFQYLVPSETLLPEESIRFFSLDEYWVWCLIDGAISVGRQATDNTSVPFDVQKFNFSGCIIRSSAISNFPDLEITANDQAPIEKRKIGKDIWLCIFRNEMDQSGTKFPPITQVELFLPPKGMRFGAVESTNSIDFDFEKRFHRLPGETGVSKMAVPILYKQDQEDKKIVDIMHLVGKMGTTSENLSSTFAFRMIEGSPKVIFKNQS